MTSELLPALIAACLLLSSTARWEASSSDSESGSISRCRFCGLDLEIWTAVADAAAALFSHGRVLAMLTPVHDLVAHSVAVFTELLGV
jgi:hypothetical protein